MVFAREFGNIRIRKKDWAAQLNSNQRANLKMLSYQSFRIAHTVISISGLLNTMSQFDPFLVEDGPESSSKIDILPGSDLPFKMEWQSKAESLEWSKDDQGEWRVDVFNNDMEFTYGSMTLSSDLKYGKITYDPQQVSEDYNVLVLLLYLFFQIQLLYAPGLLVHAAAVAWQGKGILFSAPSGTGKSTQANLWKTHADAVVINGDRPALTIEASGVFIHGLPWSGSEPVVTTLCVPATAFIMVEQAEVNELERLDAQTAVLLLMPRIFIPYYHETLASMALDHLDSILQKVPVYRLRCRPDQGAVDLVMEQISLL